jgi:pyruvate/2-oxoglutarate dehydrogenase complex dihydrolipoamide acyltransferase (E2) component
VEKTERLDWAERWLGDGFRVFTVPGGFLTLDVDVTRASQLVERLRSAGIQATFNHLFVRAAAVALSRLPELHQLVAGTRRQRPERVDIGLSVAGTTAFAPLMVIEDAGRKTLPALSREILSRIPEVREKELKDLDGLRRLGWLIPFGFLRRWILRWLMSKIWFRRKLSGTFQVSCNSKADVQASFLFNSAACLGTGRVRDAVVAVDGAPAVRQVATLSCTVDHKEWDGVRASIFTLEVKKILESGELEGEVGE